MKGPAPCMVYVDELTECDGRDTGSSQRRSLAAGVTSRGSTAVCASCNAKGPSHWVYKVFFEECVNAETGERDAKFSVYHVPIKENLHRLPSG